MTHTLTVQHIQLKIGDRPILTDIHIQCRTGRITGLLGRNGSGKTSLMRIIYSDLPCDSRTISIDNTPLSHAYVQPDLLRYMPQFPFIPRTLTLQRACLDFNTDFGALETTFPEFGPFRHHRMGHLSTGQQRLVSIYLISRGRSQFIMLDEPFTLLSPIQVEKVKIVLQEEKQNKGILITDHLHQHIWDIADEVYTLEDGRTCLTDPPVPTPL